MKPILAFLLFFSTCQKQVNQFNNINHVKNGTFQSEKNWNLGSGWKIVAGKAMFNPQVAEETTEKRLIKGLSQQLKLKNEVYLLYYDINSIDGSLIVLYGEDTVSQKTQKGEMIEQFRGSANDLTFHVTGNVVIDNIEIRNW